MKIKLNKELLLHPAIIFSAIIIGIFVGATFPRVQPYVFPLGKMYLSLLQMCILPIIITAITSSLGNILHSASASLYLKRLLIVFVVGLIVTACVGLIVGMLIEPGSHISSSDKMILGRHVANLQQTFSPAVKTTASSLSDFFMNIIPINIFYAVDQGKNLSILLFFMLLGTALGLLRTQNAKMTLSIIDTFYTGLLKIVTWIMYGLPFGLCFLFAGYVGQIGASVFFILIKLVILIIVTAFIMCFLYSLVIWRYYPRKFSMAMQALKTPWVIAFGTSSSIATIPAMLKCLQEGLGVDKYITELVVPLGININSQGTVIRFVLAGLFMAQLYGQPLGVGELSIMGLTAIFAAIAAPAVPGIVSVGIFAIVLAPLGLPAIVGIILLTAIEPIIDPFITLVNVYGNIVATLLIANIKPLQRILVKSR